MHVLVPVDGSDPADAALEYAFERFADADLAALYVMDPADGAWGPGSDWLSTAESRSEAVLSGVGERAAEAGHDVSTDSAVGRPARAIVEYVEEHAVDQVVMGSHGRDGISRVLLGSVAETVVRRSPVPVTVVRDRE
jgi:nucleotide-binding universal stress UspA family protein